MNKRRVTIALIIFVASTSLTALLLGSLSWRKYYDLARNGVATEGRITVKEPANHLSVRYSFTVNQKIFSGVESIGNSMSTLNVGDIVRVFYLSTDPTVSCFCNPNDKLKKETLTVLLGAVAASLVISVALLRKIRV